MTELYLDFGGQWPSNKFELCPFNNIIDHFKGYIKFYWSRIWNKFNKLNRKNLPITNLSLNNTQNKPTQDTNKK